MASLISSVKVYQMFGATPALIPSAKDAIPRIPQFVSIAIHFRIFTFLTLLSSLALAIARLDSFWQQATFVRPVPTIVFNALTFQPIAHHVAPANHCFWTPTSKNACLLAKIGITKTHKSSNAYPVQRPVFIATNPRQDVPTVQWAGFCSTEIAFRTVRQTSFTSKIQLPGTVTPAIPIALHAKIQQRHVSVVTPLSLCF
jgi:hypothetical protein